MSLSDTMSQELKMLAELLASEKEDTKKWLRAEMDRLVDPLVDSLLARLTNNLLIKGIDRFGGGGIGSIDGGQLIQPTERYDQLATLSQSVVHSTNYNQAPTVQVHNQFQANSTNHQFTFANQSQPIKNETMLAAQSSYRPMSIKSNLEATTENDEHSNQNLDNNFGYHDEEEEEQDCDCNDCVYGGFDGTMYHEDDSCSLILIEDDDDDEKPNSSQTVKQPSLDTTQQSTIAPQPNQVSKIPRFIALSLQCAICSIELAPNQLNLHMLEKHPFVGPFRCAVKECGQSFENNATLHEHIKVAHQHATQWNCGKCGKHFARYTLLSVHNHQNHRLGHFQCTFPGCSFTDTYRQSLYNHYAAQHRPVHNCQHAGCLYQSSNPHSLKTHERAHLGVKPYKCAWTGCDYASVKLGRAVDHVRRKHLSRIVPISSVTNGVAQLANPRDYVEVVQELLLM